tara:strand:+ start:862 stop:1575 length:714 start_codon:yes stop_codon:yes gene_type:complete
VRTIGRSKISNQKILLVCLLVTAAAIGLVETGVIRFNTQGINAQANESFVNDTTAVLKDGRTIRGTILSETDSTYSIQVKSFKEVGMEQPIKANNTIINIPKNKKVYNVAGSSKNVKKSYEQLGYEQAEEHIQYGGWKKVKDAYWETGCMASVPMYAIQPFSSARTEEKRKMDNLLKNNKSRLNVNVDMMKDEEKALYISGYGKRIKEMKTNAISIGCLGGVGGWMLLIMAAVASGP